MPALRELQAAFCAAMIAGDELPLAGLLVENGKPATERLAIYRNNIFHNLLAALRDVYPVVERLVGEEFFTAAGERYIATHPSAHGDIHCFGAFFGAFLDAFPPARTLPYLGDTARLEWLVHEAFHAAEHAPLSLADLAAIPADRHGELAFILHPSCRLLTSPFPLQRIWEVNQPDWPAEPAVDLAAGGVRLLVHRRDFVIRIEAPSGGEYAFLAALASGDALASAYEQAIEIEPDFDPGASLQRQLANKVLVGLRATLPAMSAKR